jgi:DNA (cytosine-5)-methyltransferase 1
MSSLKQLMKIKVAELFAGVGGFREAVESEGLCERFTVTWSNQWEPAEAKKAGKDQSANKVYIQKFGEEGHYPDDIHLVTQSGKPLPKALMGINMLVGGFPCQDYSVAKPKNESKGIRGPKGVLWWSIEKILDDAEPHYLLLENVDRLINSPASNRGMDFAVILKGLQQLGYVVEWRVINAAEYGFAQKRRRIFILGYKEGSKVHRATFKGSPSAGEVISKLGVLARALPCKLSGEPVSYDIEKEISSDDSAKTDYKSDNGMSRFGPAGVLMGGRAWSCHVDSASDENEKSLRAVLLNPAKNKQDKLPANSASFFIKPDSIKEWARAKGRKNEPRRKGQVITAFLKRRFGLPDSEAKKLIKPLIKELVLDASFDFRHEGQSVVVSIAREEVNQRILAAYGVPFSASRPNELDRKKFIQPLIVTGRDKGVWTKVVDGVLSIALDRAVSLLAIKDKTAQRSLALPLRPLVESAVLKLIKDNPKFNEVVGGKRVIVTRDELSDASFAYGYKEGGLPFPDDVKKPGRTIITSEGGPSVSRFKHVICDVCGSGSSAHKTPKDCIDAERLRRLYPEELERMNHFSRSHSQACEEIGASDGKRAFFMGNALVVGVVQRILGKLADRA